MRDSINAVCLGYSCASAQSAQQKLRALQNTDKADFTPCYTVNLSSQKYSWCWERCTDRSCVSPIDLCWWVWGWQFVAAAGSEHGNPLSSHLTHLLLWKGVCNGKPHIPLWVCGTVGQVSSFSPQQTPCLAKGEGKVGEERSEIQRCNGESWWLLELLWASFPREFPAVVGTKCGGLRVWTDLLQLYWGGICLVLSLSKMFLRPCWVWCSTSDTYSLAPQVHS